MTEAAKATRNYTIGFTTKYDGITMSKEPPISTLPHYRSDQPLTDPSHDAYSRRPFADGLSKSIVSLPRDECYVIGLHGPWGDGKTSVLRFVEHALKMEPTTVVAWFNPWRLSGEDALLFEFFHTLAMAGDISLKTKFKEVTKALVNYSRILRPLGPLAAFAANAIAPGVSAAVDGGTVVDAAAKWAEQFSEPTVEQQRNKLRAELLKLERPIVVFIDDIDRLESSEVASLFRLIKACADLPNVVYLLAFDREMVARTLGARLVDGDAEAGRKFLEKIIQIPVALPPAARRDLDRACMAGLDEVLKSVGLTLSDPEKLRWQWAYQDGIARRLKTPRHVAQYLNAVRFAMPLLANEVNTVDLLFVEALRVCYAPAYEIIRANQSTFIGVPIGDIERRSVGSPQDDLLAAAKEGMDPADAGALERLVEAMFPRYHVSRKGFVLGYESTKQWTRDRLVCSAAYGPRYFAYAIGSSDVADADIDAILNAAASSNSTQLRALLDKQLEALKQTMLVFKLGERQSSIPDQSASRIATILATLSDRFDEPFSLQDRNHPGIAAASLAATFCRRIESEADRVRAAQEVLEHSKEMWYASAFMRDADPAHPDPAKHPPLVSAEALPSLRSAFLSRYEIHTRLGHPQLDLERRWKFETLYSVARAGGRQRVHDRFVPNMHGDGNIAIRLLQLLAQPLARSGEILPSPGDFGPEDLESLALLVDVDAMAKIVIEQWVREDRQKGPSDWPKMNPDDRVLAQFWYHYTQRAVAQAVHTPASTEQGSSGTNPAAETTS